MKPKTIIVIIAFAIIILSVTIVIALDIMYRLNPIKAPIIYSVT